MRPHRPDSVDRRAVLSLPLSVVTLLALPQSGRPQTNDATSEPEIHPGFPALDPQGAYETVLSAHSDIDQVQRLLERQPDLSKSAIDWGFGDWETAIGAAAHMGRADIAMVLLEHGARPTLFVHAMLGHLDVVRAAVEASPGIQSTFGPHGISLLAHARSGGEGAAAVVGYLEDVGGADPQPGAAAFERERSAYLGSFRYGDGLWFEIGLRGERMYLLRGTDFPRTLHYLGDDLFHPSGSLGVRLRFRFEDQATAQHIELLDGVQTVVARRI